MFAGTEGDNGKFTLRKMECKVLCHWLEIEDWETLVFKLKTLPNISMFAMLLQNPLLPPLHEPECDYLVKINNWYKYQNDSSKERVRKHRQKQPLQKPSHVTHKKREEEKLTSKATSTSTPIAARSATLGATPPLAETAGNGTPKTERKTIWQEIPTTPERMSAEEMREIRLKSLGPRPTKI